ncbi:hypothetical protein EVAR_57287_1 [Eumeta japonica]|uniref:Uncharacterized protein n=1 Tax=Eumeta variegata TaxID=151549 RepID=A0A4C1YPE4_EUMVA|nr:hypothetical protein EVAR_57287_1 [Eumeta japonica]
MSLVPVTPRRRSALTSETDTDTGDAAANPAGGRPPRNETITMNPRIRGTRARLQLTEFNAPPAPFTAAIIIVRLSGRNLLLEQSKRVVGGSGPS